MPNLTDVLNDELEDKPTVENLALGVCVGLWGENPVNTDFWLQIGVNNTGGHGGIEWLAPNGTWQQTAVHDDGLNITFDGLDRLKIWEDALLLEATNDVLEWDGARVMVSDPIATASAVINTMVMTQADFNIITPVPFTQYLIVG